MRRRKGRLSRLSAAPDRAGVARSRPPRHRAPHPAGQVPGGQEPRQLRLPRHPVAEQDAGAGTGPLRVPDAQGKSLLLGNSGTGKTHIALALGLAACQRGHRVRFITAAALVSELIEARDEKHLLRFQKQLAAYELLIVDELGFVPLSKTGAELLFEILSQRYERASTLVTSNLPFDEWTEVFGSERLTGALLDRLTHHVHILEMNGDSYRLKQSRRKRA